MKRLWLIYASAAVGLIAIWTVLAYLPERREHNRLTAEMATAEQTVNQLRQEVEKLPGILKDKQDFSDSELSEKNDLYSHRQILDLLNRIGRQCESNGLSITEVRPPLEELIELHRTQGQPGIPQFLNITLSLEGSYAQFGQFVIGLEKTPYCRGINYARLQESEGSRFGIQFMIDFKVLL